jgi:ABC-type sugar transport system ATPase subunit
MDVRRGEIHAVIGENGAGKSTLMRILAGAETRDEGRIILEGREMRFRTPLDAQRCGVGIVYQELSVFLNLTVAENIYANRQPVRKAGVIRPGKLEEEARRLLQIFSLDLEPGQLVRDLAMADRQMIEILRAVSLSPKLLILDEPTSSLTLVEAEHLFELIERLRDQGISVLYVSHKLQEVLRLADRITVLRDGTFVGTVERADASESKLVHMMVGRALNLYKGFDRRETDPEVVLKVEGLTVPGMFEGVSFDLHRGEILGFAGLVGSGRTDVAKALFGLYAINAGRVELLGKPITPKSPRDAIAHKLAYMPEDRKTVGLFLKMMIVDNMIAPQLESVSRMGLLEDRKGMRLAERYIEEVRIVARSPRQRAMTLSGGNQQKLLLAMWLALDPRILIVDEPTRGIDVGAKLEIHEMLRKLAGEGMSIILISSELPEVLTMSDRIAVMHEGRLRAIVPKETASEEQILAIASGLEEGGIGSV